MAPWFVKYCRGIVLCLFGFGFPTVGGTIEPARIVRPLRQLELVTGERLNVEFLRLEEHACEFRWHGHTRCRLPLAAIRSIANPPGVIDHWDESFEELPAASPTSSGRSAWQSDRDDSWHRDIEPAMTTGELMIWHHMLPPDTQSVAAVLRCRFAQGNDTAELVLNFRGDGALQCDTPRGWRPVFGQHLRPSRRWSRITVRWTTERCEVVVDNAVHSVFGMESATFTGAMLESGRANDGARVALDDLIVREFPVDAGALNLPVRVEDQDSITLRSGDQLFGRFVEPLRAGEIRLQSPLGDWSGDWREIVRLDFARRPLSEHFFAPVRGWCFDVRMPSQEVASGMAENLRGVRFTGQTLIHPWLGEMAWSPSPRAVVVPYGWGEFRWLKSDRHHLGDEIRADLSPAMPVGTSLTGSVDVDVGSAGSTWVVLDAAELEPSGPRTLPTQPFLETLRGGGLRTELLVNDRNIGDLNRLISIRTSAAQPDRLWLSIPRQRWRAGRNTWAVRQQPLSPIKPQYDDCEISHVALWIPGWP